eukprot:1517533-Prymnesium_polylepis.1
MHHRPATSIPWYVAGVLRVSDVEAVVGHLHDMVGHELLVHGTAWRQLPLVVPIGDKLQRHGLGARHWDAAPARRVGVGGHLKVTALVHHRDLLAVVVVAVHGDQPIATEVRHAVVCVARRVAGEDAGRGP